MLHNQILSNKKTKKKLPLILISFGLFALFCIVSVFGVYSISFKDFSFIADTEKFGQFGDFVGGTLNPILAFLSFMALLYTIKIQMDELKLSREELESTRKELEGSRIAQQEQSESLKLQNKAAKIQIFENTFFQLLNQHNEYLDLLIQENCLKSINLVKYKQGNYGNLISDVPLEKNEVYKTFRNLNQTKRVMKNYYMVLYQLLKFIDEKSKDGIINVKVYTNIVRALIDDEVLRTLAINCEAYSFKEYKNYIEKYAFFEHIYINANTIDTETILNILKLFDKKAFGKNEHILKIFDKLNSN